MIINKDDELDFDTVVDMLRKALQDAENDTDGGDFARGRSSALRYALSLMDALGQGSDVQEYLRK